MNVDSSYYTSFTAVIAAIVFLVIAGVIIVLFNKRALFKNAQMRQRLKSGSADEVVEGDMSRWLGSVGNHLSLPDDKEITRVRYFLSQAGYFSPNAVNGFYIIRLLAVTVPQIALILYWVNASHNLEVKQLMMLSAFLALFGLLGPSMFVKQRKAKRTLSCREGFPDMMDLLIACIEAGLSLDAALIRVANELGKRYPALKVGLDIMNLELRAGRSRHEALLNFAQRVDLEEAKSLAVMLKQSEDMGSSLGSALRTFSEDMRLKRMLLAEEKALALSAKLTLPLIVFIFPTIMIILLMPAGIRLARGFAI